MKNESKPTPAPWEMHEGEDYIVVMSADQTTDNALARVDTVAHAALIVRAVNSHDDLLAALEGALPILHERAKPFGMGSSRWREYDQCRAALAKAKGE